MSAVLYAPIINPIFKTLDPDFKSSLRELMITLVKEDKEFREILTAIIEECNVKSEVINRLAIIDTKLGINDFRGFSKALEGREGELTIPEEIAILKQQSVTAPLRCEFQNFPQDVTDYRTDFLLKFMENKELDHDIPELYDVKNKENCIYVGPKEFEFFIKFYLPEKYQPKSFKNLRKIRRDVFKNAEERYLKKVWVAKGIGGKKQLKLVALKRDQTELSTTQ